MNSKQILCEHVNRLLRDSVYIREVLKGDTVYLTHIEYRDRWRTRLVHDTIIRTDSITQIIEHPPRKYIPSFYKRSTIALWVAIALGVLYVILRWYITKKTPLA